MTHPAASGELIWHSFNPCLCHGTRLWREEVRAAAVWSQMCLAETGEPGGKRDLRARVLKERGAKSRDFVRRCVKERFARVRTFPNPAGGQGKLAVPLLPKYRDIALALELEWLAVRFTQRPAPPQGRRGPFDVDPVPLEVLIHGAVAHTCQVTQSPGVWSPI